MNTSKQVSMIRKTKLRVMIFRTLVLRYPRWIIITKREKEKKKNVKVAVEYERKRIFRLLGIMSCEAKNKVFLFHCAASLVNLSAFFAIFRLSLWARAPRQSWLEVLIGIIWPCAVMTNLRSAMKTRKMQMFYCLFMFVIYL